MFGSRITDAMVNARFGVSRAEWFLSALQQVIEIKQKSKKFDAFPALARCQQLYFGSMTASPLD
ncbi:hypothetical protein FHR23_000241 [Stakelama sediminis]|uniref:Uncharacterized protein n=1 Tax=Stakelama sediminis TaxID=463200 RepID=A0A840YUW6_9SPHN|nr:hypothetical protein [Stakelama sediminis]MBB5717334.1 hypothetical protein [Stakelama sediminis]